MKLTENQKVLFAAVSDIEDEYIEKADQKRKHPVVQFLKRIAVVAAVLAILFGLAQIIPALVFSPRYERLIAPDIPDGLFFVVTAQATSSENKFSFPDWWLSSTSRDYKSDRNNSFPKAPAYINTFQFMVHLPGRCIDYALVIEYNGNVCYNGIVPKDPEWKITDPNLGGYSDKHIGCGQVTYPDIKDRQAFSLSGWFEETTVVHLKLYRKADGVLLQEQSIQVEYISKSNSYVLTVLEANTYETGG